MRISTWLWAAAAFALVAALSGFFTLQLMKGEEMRQMQGVHAHEAFESGMIAIPKRKMSGAPVVRPVRQEVPQAVMPPCVIGQCQDV